MPSTTQAAVQAPAVSTPDPRTALVTDLWELVQALDKAESAGIAAEVSAVVATFGAPEGAPEADIAQMKEDQAGVDRLAREGIDKLVIARLVANRRGVPLLQTGDTDRILGQFLHGETMDDSVLAGMALLRPVVERRISSVVNILFAVSPNLYEAFWLLAGALLNEAKEGLTPYELIELPGGRAQVYKNVMGPDDWRKLGARTVALLSGLKASATIGGIASLVEDEAATAFESRLQEADEAAGPVLKAIVKAVRAYFASRGREIWGRGTTTA